MKLAEAIEIILDVARHRLTSEHTSDDVEEASSVVEDFFANHVFDGTEEEEKQQ